MSTTCPRCGYDVSAIPPTWVSQCPVQGTCSECGLEFAWGDLLNARLMDEAIFFEHAERRRVRSFWITLRRVLRPRRFWAWVRMEWPIDPVRLVRFALFGAFALYMLGNLLHAFAYSLASIWSPWTPWGGAFGRTWMTETALKLADGALPICVQDWALALYYGFGSPWMFEPLPIVALTSWLLTPLAFAALPETLRRCRVRRVHLLRVWMYGPVPVLLLLQLPRIGDFVLSAFGVHSNRGLVGHVQMLLVLGWQAAWWWRAVRYYLRLPQAGAIAAAVLTMSFLAAVLIWMSVAGGWAYDGFLGPSGIY